MLEATKFINHNINIKIKTITNNNNNEASLAVGLLYIARSVIRSP